MKILRDQFGIIPALNFKAFYIVWSWPRGGMAWFFWGWGKSYRIGPVTVTFLR